MEDIDQYAHRIAITRGLTEVETDGWHVERWEISYGSLVMAYERDSEEWRASHYYRPDGLWSDGTETTRHAYTGYE